MNYLQEINEFYRWLDTNPLQGSAINLWHALMSINNSSKWKKFFTAAMSTLESKTGYDRKTIFKARKTLTEAGLIRWETRGSKLAAMYTIVPISSIEATEIDDEDDVDLTLEVFDSERVNNTQLSIQLETTSKLEEANQIDSLKSSLEGMKDGTQMGIQKGMLLGTKEGTQTGLINKQNKTIKKKKKKEPKGSMSSRDDLQKLIKRIFDEYNSICKNLIPAQVLTRTRRGLINARLGDNGYENILKMLQIASQSDFLGGANNRNWIASIDWLFRPNNFAKVLENNYRNKASGAYADHFHARPSNLELIEETYSNLMADEKFNNC